MNKPFYKLLYVQVIIGIAVGVLIGAVWPKTGVQLLPLGEGFIKLVKMVVGPIIFCTVVAGIASMQGMKQLGRIGGKALLYFEVVSTIALLIGVIAATVLRPGSGFNADPKTLDASSVQSYASRAHDQSLVSFLLQTIPDTFVGAFARGEILQILLLSIFVGLSLHALGERGRAVRELLDQVTQMLFHVIAIVTKAAPVGAMGAIGFTVGKYGLASLLPLLKLIGTFYAVAFTFVVVVLGGICGLARVKIWSLLAYLKEELLIVLGTSSSEAALPQLMDKMEKAGCSKQVVGLVVPTGYSFNLDGTNIYISLAILFIAQAMNIELSFAEQATIFGVAMLTSKGASGVTGAGFVTLAATLAVVPSVPLVGLVLLLGVDRFMSECRALTNFIGNAVACIVVSAWEGELDRSALKERLEARTQRGVEYSPS